MNINFKESERGQAIVYLVLGLVVFLGFVALAIDGGMALSDRRHSQNSADAASLAGGGIAAEYMEDHNVTIFNWNCSSNANIVYALDVAESTAISRAGTNNYTIDHGITQNNGTIAACGSTSYVGYTDHYIDVTVDISATTQSNFLQIIFPEALHNEVAAVTRIRPRQPPAFGNAIVALNPAGCQGAGTPGGVMYGSTNILIEGGGIFSNGCLRGNGHPNITITGGPIPIGNELQPGNAEWTPDPEVTDLQTDPAQFDFGTPNCTGHTMANLPNSKPPQPPLDGLYCITGNLSINAHDYITGTNVTIYIPNGKLTINGGAQIYLSAPDANNPPPNTDAIPGVLFYVPNGQAVELNGTSDSWFIGMVLAPKSNVTLNGTSGNSYRGQVIGWNVNVGGTADVFIIYNPEEGYNVPTSMELAR